MKKLFTVLIALMIGVSALSAQKVFNKNELVLSASIGVGGVLDLGAKTTFPPIVISGDYCIIDRVFDNKSAIGVGGFLGFAGGKSTYPDYTFKTNGVLLSTRGTFHYQFVDRLDTYAGISLGYTIASTKVSGANPGYDANYGGFIYDIVAGARYYLSDNFAVFGELGFHVAFMSIGVSFKM